MSERPEELPISYIVKSGPTLMGLALAILHVDVESRSVVTFVVQGVVKDKFWPEFILRFRVKQIHGHVRGELWILFELVESTPKGLVHSGATTYAPIEPGDDRKKDQQCTFSLSLPPGVLTFAALMAKQ